MDNNRLATYKFAAKGLMAEKVVCVHPETPMNDLIKILVKNHITGAPVDKAGKLVGVVSRTDIVEYDEKTNKKREVSRKNRFIATPF